MWSRIRPFHSRVEGSPLSSRSGPEIRPKESRNLATLTLKSFLKLAERSIIIVAAFSSSAFAQTLSVPPDITKTNTFFNVVIVNSGGTLTGTGLTLGNIQNPNTPIISLNGQNGNAVAILTNTTLNFGNQSSTTPAISATGPGAMLTISGFTTFTGNSQRIGVMVTSGATVVIEDGSKVNLNFTGGQGTGLVVNDSTLSLTNTQVVMGTTNHNTGVNASNGATVELSGGLVNMPSSGDTNTGLLVNASNLFVNPSTVSGTTVSMTGTNDNFGVNAISGAIGNISGASVSVAATGDRNMGLAANNSMLSVTGTDVSVTGTNNNVGVNAANGGLVDMSGGSVFVRTTGSGNIGASALGGSTVTLENTSVEVLGNSNIGVQADGEKSQLSANDSLITVTGNNGIGAFATNGGAIGTRSESITVNGNNPTGVKLNNSGVFQMAGGSVTTTGSGGQAILVSGTGSIAANTQNHGTFDGTTVTSQNGIGILAQAGGQDSTLDFFNGASLTPANGINGTLLLDQADGTVSLNGTNKVVFEGNVDATGAKGKANVTLSKGSMLTGSINKNQLQGAVDISSFEGAGTASEVTALPPGLPRQNVNLLVGDPSTWNMTASSTLGQLEVADRASININFNEPPGTFRTLVAQSLTLVPNNSTDHGATFGMNVDLPKFRGDLLVIQTPTGGFSQHLLQITNPNQSQDPQVNRALLVVISAQTSGLEFPSNIVDAGSFKYESRRGDKTPLTPDPNNWYLVRTDTPEPGPTPTPIPTPPPSPTPPPIPTPTPLPNPTPLPTPLPFPTPTPSATPTPSPTPNPTPSPTPPGGEGQIDFPKQLDPPDALTNTANAAIGTYSSTIPLFYADMQTLVERMGELRLGIQAAAPPVSPSPKEVVEGKGLLEAKQVVPVPAPPPNSEWSVWVRGFGSGMRINNDVSRVFNQDVGGFQIGADRRFEALWSGDVYLGMFAGYIYASRDFLDGGTGSTNAFSLGTYATWIHPQGWYADAVFKYTQMWNYFSTPNLEGFTSTGYYNIPAIGGSLEFGKRFDFAGGRFFIEPEAQLAGVWEGGMDYTASNGLLVHGDDQTSLQGRLGGRLGVHFDLSQGLAIEPYAKAEVIEEFLTGNNVRTDNTTFVSSLSGTVGRFGGGITARLSQSVYLYGEYDYATGDHIQEPWSVTGGFRWQW
jgi:outer membrane autotransporter protein